jgi:predicted nucleic acid-binding protein
VLVIDASALVEVLTDDPADIPELVARVRNAEWMSAPDLLDYEVLNVLRKMVLRKDIDVELAESCRLALADLRLSRYPLTEEMAERVWELRNGLSAYDAAYVVLAEHLGVPLITADRRLARAAMPLSAIRIEAYVGAGFSD